MVRAGGERAGMVRAKRERASMVRTSRICNKVLQGLWLQVGRSYMT